MKVGNTRGEQSEQMSVEQLKAAKTSLTEVMMAIICSAATVEVLLHLFLRQDSILVRLDSDQLRIHQISRHSAM